MRTQLPLDESSARRIVLVQAFDAAETPLWTPEDRAWASRLAAETAPADASAERLLAERAHHALQRLEPRDHGVRRWLARAPWRWRWVVAAAALGAGAGLMADLLGRLPLVDLLAPPVWGVIAWNLAIYAILLVQALRRPVRRAGAVRRLLLAWWQRAPGRGPLRVAAARWADLTASLTQARLAVLLHVAAAALGAGLIAGLYLRGLVLDFRAGWQSTFLDAAAVRQALAALLAPASALTGIGIPDTAAIEAMRVTPDAPQGQASAAPWIHLYAATLALVVVVPRLLLALGALVSAQVRARRLPLPVDNPVLASLLRRHRGGVTRILVLPYAAAPGAQAALGLRAILARVHGDDLQLQMGEVTPVGDEETAARRTDAGVALRVALVDLGATPEAEHHGRFLQALRGAAPAEALLLVADEAQFRRRFGGLPGRLDERRAAWQRLAEAHSVPLLCADLETPDLAQAEAALKKALTP